MTSAVYWATRRTIDTNIERRGVSRQPHQFLWMALSGTGEMTLEGKHYRIEPGRMFTGRLDQLRLCMDEAPQGYSFQWCAYFLEDAPELPVCPIVEDLELLNACFLRLVNAFRREGPRAPGTIRWMWAIVQQLLEDNRVGPEGSRAAIAPLTRVCQQIDASPGEDWSVAELARELGLSEGHFSRSFKAQSGRSPRDYITTARIHAAQDLLRESKWPIGVIAERLGFGDIYHFSKQFRQHVGSSPSAWRLEQ